MLLVHDSLGLGWCLERRSCALGARLRRRTATQRSKKGSEKVLGRVPGEGL